MGNSCSPKHKDVMFGVIAEDDSDCEAIKVLINRLAPADSVVRPSVKCRRGDGGGGVKQRGARFLSLLADQGCSAFIIVHDRDSHEESTLRETLAKRVVGERDDCIICIPCEELEAWFWSDQRVLDAIATKPGLAKAAPNPHLVKDPKGALTRLSMDGRRRPRYAVTDNAQLMKLLDIEACARACPAMHELRTFIAGRLSG